MSAGNVRTRGGTPAAPIPSARRQRAMTPAGTAGGGADGGGPYDMPVARAPRIPRQRPSILDLFLRNLFAGARP